MGRAQGQWEHVPTGASQTSPPCISTLPQRLLPVVISVLACNLAWWFSPSDRLHREMKTQCCWNWMLFRPLSSLCSLSQPSPRRMLQQLISCVHASLFDYWYRTPPGTPCLKTNGPNLDPAPTPVALISHRVRTWNCPSVFGIHLSHRFSISSTGTHRSPCLDHCHPFVVVIP